MVRQVLTQFVATVHESFKMFKTKKVKHGGKAQADIPRVLTSDFATLVVAPKHPRRQRCKLYTDCYKVARKNL